MRKEYKDELIDLKTKMIKAEKFAKKVPMFSEKILTEKITGEEHWLKCISYYKNLRTYDGVSRGFFESGTNRSISNIGKKHSGYYWTLYINTLTEYGSHAKYGLGDIHKNIPVFFYDNLNSTFYCTDAQIETLLEALDVWIVKAKEQARLDSLDDLIRKAEDKLKIGQDNLIKLKRRK